MARFSVSGNALRHMVEDVESIRREMRKIDLKYKPKGVDNFGEACWDEDYNRKRDWYLRLIEGGAENIMIEESDWQGYFHWIGTDLEVHEQQMKEWWKAEQQRRTSEVNCPVLESEREEIEALHANQGPDFLERFFTRWF